MSDELDAGPIPDELRALLEAEKARPGPAGDVEQRVLRRLVGSIGLGTPPWSSPDTSAVPAPAAPDAAGGAVAGAAVALSPLARMVGAAAIFATGTVAGAGGYHLVRDDHAAPPPAPMACEPDKRAPATAEPPPSVPAAPVDDGSAQITRATGNPHPTLRPGPRAKAPAISPSSEAIDDGLATERGLLEIARSALVRGQAESALGALGRHARAFPDGLLAEEREGLTVQALVVARHFDQARTRGASFKERYPRSLFSPLVEQALRSIP